MQVEHHPPRGATVTVAGRDGDEVSPEPGSPADRAADLPDATGGAGAHRLSIGDLAQLTGVATATLRVWEQRHGFPTPHRLDSGHRRYSEADVLAVRRVLERQEEGVRLDRAIAQSLADTQRTAAPSSPSVYATLHRGHPHLTSQRLSKATLLALSWAIEDEFMARADRPHLFGAFQQGRYFERSADRWDGLARIARSTYVMADFGGPRTADTDPPITTPGGAVRVHLDADSPMRREWAVVCDAVDLPVALTAWELPGQSDVADRDRIFESIWTLDPAAVRAASRVCAQVAQQAAAPGAARTLYDLAETPLPGTADLASVSSLFSRVVGYVDRFAMRPALRS